MATAAAAYHEEPVVDAKRVRLVILSSSLGTVFEWYDFFVYGTLAVLIAKLFFPAASEGAGLLLALEAVWERQRNEGGRSGSGMIPEVCDTFTGATDVEPDRPRAA